MLMGNNLASLANRPWESLGGARRDCLIACLLAAPVLDAMWMVSDGFSHIFQSEPRHPGDFLHRVVVGRTDTVVRSWRNWIKEGSCGRPSKWFWPDLVLPSISS